MTDPTLVSTVEASMLLGKSRRTVLRLVERGELVPAHRLPGATGSLVFRRSDVEALVGAA